LAIGNNLLRFFVTSVLAATATELTEFQPLGRGLLVLGRHVVPTLAILALKHNVIAWHNLFPISDCQFSASEGLFNWQLAIGNWQ
jgi:hypothetical protein